MGRPRGREERKRKTSVLHFLGRFYRKRSGVLEDFLRYSF